MAPRRPNVTRHSDRRTREPRDDEPRGNQSASSFPAEAAESFPRNGRKPPSLDPE